LPSFLDNHDMNRFLWVVGGDVRRLQLAALCQFTLPHPPIIYYGTEVGLSQRHDLEYPDGSRRMEESRTPMPWGADQDQELLQFYKRLIALRRQETELWSGERRTLAVNDAGCYVFEISHGERTVIVGLNRGTVEQHVVVSPDATLSLSSGEVRLVEGRLVLGAMSGALLFC